MSSSTTEIAAAVAVFGVVGLLYAASIVNELVLGLGIAVACFVVAALLYAGGTNRETVAGVAMAVTVVYGVFTLQLPAAIVGACIVYLTLWVTDPDGPFDATPPTVFPQSGSESVADVATEQEAAE